jgi:DNA-binding NarL/FixJ family response regulator
MAEQELDELESIYRTSTLGAGPVDVVEVVRGADAIRHRFHQLQLAAREEVVSFIKAPASVVTGAENTAEGAALARGVRYRTLVERAMLDDDPDLFHEIVSAQAVGEQVRMIDQVPLKLVVVDGEVAFLPLVSDADPATTGVIVVRQSALLDALAALFEAKWEQAIPVVTAAETVAEVPAGGIDDLDTRILSLLLTGLTDQAVAANAETSLRTVQRRIRYLMDRTGSETRLQLGYHAARMGWV